MAEITFGSPVEPLVVKDIPKEPVTRPSDPFKQGLAGLSDIATGIPAVLGLAGAGIESGFQTLTGEGDQSFADNFSEALSSGLDATLLEAGTSGRSFVNKILGIEEPISTEDQAARLLASVIPIPGFVAAANAGRLAKLATGTANILTPAVKRGKGFGIRAASQAGLGLGIEQGARALTDTPLIFSEEALTGIPEISFGEPVIGGAEDDQIIFGDPVPALTVPQALLDAPESKQGLEALLDLDQRVQREQDWEDTKFWMLMAGVALGSGAAIKWARSGRTDTAWQQTKEMGNYVFEKSIDKSHALDDALKDVDISTIARDKVVHNSHTDPVDIADNFNLTGRLGQGFTASDGKIAHSPIKLANSRIALGENKELFDEAMVAQSQRATIQNIEQPDPVLWAKAQGRIKDMDDTIVKARNIPEVKQLMDEMSETFDVLLDYQVWRGSLSKIEAAAFRAKATLDDVPGGRLTYMPLYAKTEQSFLRNLARNYLGINTRQGRMADVVEEFGARDINIQVPEELFSPIQALKRYALSTISHANTESFKGNVLDSLARISRSGDDIFRVADPEGQGFLATGRDTLYVGKGTDLDDIDNIPIEIFGGDPNVAKRGFKSGSINDLRAKYGDEIKTAHVNGELRVYHVPDKGLQAAIELNPRLGTGLQALSNWKNLFTQFTTGQFSLFAPISGLFSAQQVGINVFAREGTKAGLKSVGQSLKGTKRLMAESGSGAIARFLATRIARHTAAGKIPPQVMVKLEKALERKFIDATMNQVRTETGRTVTSVGNIGNGTIEQIMEGIGKDSSDFFGKEQMGLVKELWQSWNTAWHEGPAYGAMLRHIDEIAASGKDVTPQTIRDAVDISKTVAGDMRRIGASGFAKAFNASVPFSAAMLQSWNSIGGAMKANPLRFMAGISALIGVPTLSEMVYNASLSDASGTFPDAGGKEWTYNDYYWNGFTTQQRNDNFIYFIPGKPPWEAVVVPVSPEWGLYRATVMEAADAIFNLSDVGSIGLVDQTKVNRSMFLGALMRVMDLPLPPPLAAAASGLGMDVRVGLATEVRDDPDDPGRVTSLLRTTPIGQGERVTRRAGKSRFAQGDLDRTVAAMIQDIFGAAGTSYINVHEAFNAGTRGRRGSIKLGIEQSLDAFGQTLKQQARYTQPLLGKALRPNANDEIAESLFVSRANLKRLSLQLRNGFLGGGIAYADGQRIVGQLPLPDDPINLELAAMASKIDANIGQLDGQITALRRDLSTMGNATNLGTTAQKFDQMDAKTLEIQAVKAQQLAVLHDFEMKVSDFLTERYGRDIEIDLTSFTPRPDTTEGSTLKGLLSSPQTSQ